MDLYNNFCTMTDTPVTVMFEGQAFMLAFYKDCTLLYYWDQTYSYELSNNLSTNANTTQYSYIYLNVFVTVLMVLISYSDQGCIFYKQYNNVPNCVNNNITSY